MKRNSAKRGKIIAKNYESTMEIFKNAGFISDPVAAIKTVDETKLPILERVTCRKCIDQYLAEKTRCSYCNNTLVLAPVVVVPESVDVVTA